MDINYMKQYSVWNDSINWYNFVLHNLFHMMTGRVSVKRENREKGEVLTKIDWTTHGRIYSELVDEVGEDVLLYLSEFPCLKSPNILFLSSVRHYLYDSKELSQVDTLINFRALNGTRHISFYLQTMNQLLPEEGYFIGCFVDYSTFREEFRSRRPTTLRYIFLMSYIFVNRVIPRVPLLNAFQSAMIHGKKKCLTPSEVVCHLDKHGFKVLDMTVIDGVTYFVSQKIRQTKMRMIPVFKLLKGYRSKTKIINV